MVIFWICGDYRFQDKSEYGIKHFDCWFVLGHWLVTHINRLIILYVILSTVIFLCSRHRCIKTWAINFYYPRCDLNLVVMETARIWWFLFNICVILRLRAQWLLIVVSCQYSKEIANGNRFHIVPGSKRISKNDVTVVRFMKILIR